MNSAKKASTSNQKKQSRFEATTREQQKILHTFIYNIYKMYMYLNLFMAKPCVVMGTTTSFMFFFFRWWLDFND